VKKMKWAMTLTIALLVAGSGVAAWRYYHQDRPLVTYQTETAKRRDIAAAVQATGVIRAQTGAEVKVGARISGRVERLFANIGDLVQKGQLIARLEQVDLLAKVEEARMNLRTAEANLELAGKNIQRMQNLFAQGFVARDKVDVAERDVKITQAQVEQLRANIRFNETQMSYADIYAPISGVIAAVTTQQGETVSASSLNVPTFVTIVDLNRLEIYAYVDETDIGKIKPGLAATFTVDSFPEKDFSGTVSAIYPKATIQDNVVYYITLITIDNSEGKLKPDMTVSATILLDKRSNILTVPNRAIKREGGKKVVEVLEQGRAVTKTIRTGWKDGGYTEVLDGVKEGEAAITGEAVQAAE